MSIASTAAAAPARLRLDHVDGMRALAALIVYLNHAYAQISTGDTQQLQGALYYARWSMIAGHLSVTVFIVLSGFCLTLPVVQHGGTLRGGVKEFLKRRARRILPPYYAALALCLLMIWTIIGEQTGTLWDYPARVTGQSIIAHLLLLQDLFATSRINYVFWSIAVEWHIYFLVPLLVLAWARFGAWKVVLGALVVGFALRFGFADTRLSRAHPQFIGMFALGMLAAYFVSDARYQRYREAVPWALVSAVALAIAAGFAVSWGVPVAHGRFHYLDLPVGIMAMAALISSSRPVPNALNRVLAAKPLVFVGTFSYSLYLVHAPFLQALWQYVLNPLRLSREWMLVALMTGGLAVILVISYVFFLAFEAPFLRAARRARAVSPAAVGAG